MLLYIDSQIAPHVYQDFCPCLSNQHPASSFIPLFPPPTMHFDFVEVFKPLNFLLIPFTPLVLQCFIFCSAGLFFAQYPLREWLVLLISLYGLDGAVIIPWIQGWTCDQAWPIIMLHFFSCNASFRGGHVNQIWLAILGKKHPLSLGVSKLMKGKPVPAADHFGYCSGRTCQRMKPTQIEKQS